MLPRVAIIGRPNVGKSTLFNRLVGRRLALVDDRPGVTRDRREAEGSLYGLDFLVVDTAGLEDVKDKSLEARMRQQSERAVAEAAVVLFVIDGREGVTTMDQHFANWLRRSGRPVILIANKCESQAAELIASEANRLGLGEPIAVSAEHALGLSELADALQAALEKLPPPTEIEPAEEAPLQLAVVGRPNVGKSTLINRLIGEDRLLTGPEAGITRDAIAIDWEHKGRRIRLVDTAGLRRRGKITERLEQLSAADTLHTINFAQVVILVVDAGQPLEKQDLTIAGQVIEEGRGLVIAVNKWDTVEDPAKTLKLVRERIEDYLPQVAGVPCVTVSALTGRKLDDLLDSVFDVFELWNRKIPTAELNRWLSATEQAHPPPAPHGRRIRFKYMTQAKTRPPTFHIFATQFDDLPDSYMRYLENAMRQDLKLPATPLRLILRRADNPYGKKPRES